MAQFFTIVTRLLSAKISSFITMCENRRKFSEYKNLCKGNLIFLNLSKDFLVDYLKLFQKKQEEKEKKTYSKPKNKHIYLMDFNNYL